MPNINIKGSTEWGTAQIETITQLLKEHYAGDISIYNYWGIGNEREITLSGEINETVQYVLTGKGVYTLASDENVKCAFTLDQKNCLSLDRPMNEVCTNKGGWRECDLRAWLNSVYASSMPDEYKDIFKDFITEGDVVDRFALRSEKEIFGKAIYGVNDDSRQIEYYKPTRNKIKCISDDFGETWFYWERSPRSGNLDGFCGVFYGGGAGNYIASCNGGLAPFGCI